jgi:hypothetical protein
MDSLIINRQWAHRANEERFVTLLDLHEYNLAKYRASAQKVMPIRNIEAVTAENDESGFGLNIRMRDSGKLVNLSNWSYNQLAGDIGIPPGFVAKLPAYMAKDIINWGVSNADESAKSNFLATKTNDQTLIRSITGEKYGRIWDHQVSAPLVERFGDGITGDWKVPGEFGKEVEVTKRNTTLYAGEQDTFVCLVDEKNRIEVPNRRNGNSGSVARGFIVTNSEVGSGVLGLYFFTFDYICQNRTIWGLGNVKEIKVRHTVNAPDRWIDEVAPAIEHYGQIKASLFEDRMRLAQKTMLDKPAEEILLAKLALPNVNRKMVNAICSAYAADEPDHPIMESVFDLTVGVTAYARTIEFQNIRAPVERAAGKFFEMVS